MIKKTKFPMISGFLFFLSCYNQQIFAQQITAVTVTGDTVFIYPDNSWQFKSDKIAAVTSLGDTLLLANAKWEYVLPFADSIKDIDGNTYSTVKIGEQVWMAENLRVTKFRDGRLINKALKTGDWKIDRPSYAFYDNDSTYAKDFGALYSWKSASDSCLCPKGWRVPTKEDFITLLNGSEYASNRSGLLDGKSEYWSKVYYSSNKVNGFSARGSGHRNMSNEMKFVGLKQEAVFYTSSISAQYDPYFFSISNYDKNVIASVGNYDGTNPRESRLFALSVRCIRKEKRLFPKSAVKPKPNLQPTKPSNNNSQSGPHVIIEESEGMNGRLKFVYIRNLENYPIKVKYKRTNQKDGESSTFEVKIDSRSKYEVGYNCHTVYLSNICAFYYSTEIIDVVKQ